MCCYTCTMMYADTELWPLNFVCKLFNYILKVDVSKSLLSSNSLRIVLQIIRGNLNATGLSLIIYRNNDFYFSGKLSNYTNLNLSNIRWLTLGPICFNLCFVFVWEKIYSRKVRWTEIKNVLESKMLLNIGRLHSPI